MMKFNNLLAGISFVIACVFLVLGTLTAFGVKVLTIDASITILMAIAWFLAALLFGGVIW